MTGTKPKLMWHADGEGKCHLACEQAFQNNHDFNTAEVWCQLMAKVVPMNARMHTNGDECPFAVLADVLCAAKPHEDEPDSPGVFTATDLNDWLTGYERAGTTTAEEMRLIRGLRVWLGSVEPDPKPDDDRRCGTCAAVVDARCPFVRAYDKAPVVSDWMVTFDSGPPWPNCRFWRGR